MNFFRVGWFFCALGLLLGVESVVEALRGHQLVVSADLSDQSVVQHDDVVCVPDGRQTVSDHDARPTLLRALQRLLNYLQHAQATL